MRPRQPVYVLGGAHTPFLGRAHPDFVSPRDSRRRNPTLEEHLHRSIRDALSVTGVAAEQIDKGYVGNFLGECFSSQGHLGAMAVGADPGLSGRPFARVEAACASGGVAIAACIDALAAGRDVVLAVGAEVETNARGRVGVDYMARAAHYETERPLSQFTFPHLFGRRAWAYKQAHGDDPLATARVVEKAHRNARDNPLALMQSSTTTLQDAAEESTLNAEFLEDVRYRPHLRMLDCTQFTDGASAVVLATARGLEKLGIDPAQCTEIVACSHTVRALGAPLDPSRLDNVADAAAAAYRSAGLLPADVQLAEVHDCFSIAELQLYEALGFCGPGEAAGLLERGVVERDGRLPVNPGGGLLGFGHPVGATGIKQVVEIWRQMKGRCGSYQVTSTPRIAISANIGGDDRTAVVMLHRDCS
jgi:acetyl-CoA acyltransferase